MKILDVFIINYMNICKIISMLLNHLDCCNYKNELTAEFDIVKNRLIEYDYDNHGNITSKVVNGVTYNG